MQVKKASAGEWGMNDVRGWESLCILDFGGGYQCQTDYNCNSLISAPHTSLYRWTPFFLSSLSLPRLPLPLQPAETLDIPLQCLQRSTTTLLLSPHQLFLIPNLNCRNLLLVFGMFVIGYWLLVWESPLYSHRIKTSMHMLTYVYYINTKNRKIISLWAELNMY